MRWILTVLPPLALSAYAACCLLAWVEQDWRPNWDDALYILTGRSLASGEGYVYLDRPFFLRPPGLAWLISLIQGTRPFDPGSLNRMIMAFSAASVVALFLTLRAVYGRWTSLGVALLFGTAPLVVEQFNFVRADFPFFALLFAGIALLQDSPCRMGESRLRTLGAVLCIVAAFYMRSAALVLLPAMLVFAWWSDGWARLWRMAFPVVAVLTLALPWLFYQTRAAASAEVPADQLLLFDYWTAMFRSDVGDPSSPLIPPSWWLARILFHGMQVLRDMGDTVVGAGGVWSGSAIAALALVGILRRPRERPSLFECFSVVYVVMLLSYFSYAPRLATPLLPIVYLHVLTGISGLAKRLSSHWPAPQRFVPLVTAASFAILMAINLVRLPDSLDPRRGNPALAAAWRDMYATALWIRENTAEDAVLLSHQAPVYALLAERRIYTYRFRRDTDLLARYDPDYVVFDVIDQSSQEFHRQVRQRARQRWLLPSHHPDGRISIYRMPDEPEPSSASGPPR